jgi:hypothetical protein
MILFINIYVCKITDTKVYDHYDYTLQAKKISSRKIEIKNIE